MLWTVRWAVARCGFKFRKWCRGAPRSILWSKFCTSTKYHSLIYKRKVAILYWAFCRRDLALFLKCMNNLRFKPIILQDLYLVKNSYLFYKLCFTYLNQRTCTIHKSWGIDAEPLVKVYKEFLCLDTPDTLHRHDNLMSMICNIFFWYLWYYRLHHWTSYSCTYHVLWYIQLQEIWFYTINNQA